MMKLLVIVIQRDLGYKQHLLLNLHEKHSSKIQKMTPKWPKIAKKSQNPKILIDFSNSHHL